MRELLGDVWKREIGAVSISHFGQSQGSHHAASDRCLWSYISVITEFVSVLYVYLASLGVCKEQGCRNPSVA